MPSISIFIAFLWLLRQLILANDAPESSDTAVKSWPYQTYRSSNATAPVFRINRSGEALAKGLLFMYPDVPNQTPLIMTDRGELVWSGEVESGADLHVQQLYGKPVLTRWLGQLPGAVSPCSYGKISVLDATYSEILEVCPKFGLVTNLEAPPDCEADVHTHVITDKGTIILIAYNITTADLRPISGPKDGWIVDGQFYEMDIKTGKILFKWSSADHIPVTQSRLPLSGAGGSKGDAYDYFHLNSVQPIQGGSYLITARHASAVYLIDPMGGIEWQFNGYNGGDFKPLPVNGHFSFSHDAEARFLSKNSLVLHLFNNNLDDVHKPKPSNGLKFQLNIPARSVKLLREVHDPYHDHFSIAQGNYMALPNGHVLIGYGAVPLVQEFGPKSNYDLRLSIRFSNSTNLGNYKAYRQHWHAVPTTRPSVALDEKYSEGWVSWNGATSVSHYKIYVGNTPTKLTKAAGFEKKGFETKFKLPKRGYQDYHYVQLAAYEGKTLLRKSRVIHVRY